MSHLHFTRNLRTLVHLLFAAAIIAVAATLWWANHTGLPDSWRANIEKAIAKEGAHIKIGALKYVPFHGVIASDVRVFSDSHRLHQISRLESIVLSVDRTKLSRGEVHLNKIQLRNARLTLPVDPGDPDSEKLEVTNANGTLLMPGERRFEIRDATGTVEGIEVSLDARLIGYRTSEQETSDNEQYGTRRNLLANILQELANWRFSPESPPQLHIDLEGDANDHSSFHSKIRLIAREMEKNQHRLENVHAVAELQGYLMTVTSLRASDSRGDLEASLDYNLWDRDGRFDFRSSLDIPTLLQSWFDLPPVNNILFGGNQQIEAAGDFQFPQDAPPVISVTGAARCQSVLLKGIPFDAISANFCWKEGNLYMRDLLLARPDGEASGKVMIQWPKVRIAVRSSLPTAVGKPLFAGKPLEKILGDFSPLGENASAVVNLEGGFDIGDKKSWYYSGTATVRDHSYRGVPLRSVTSSMVLNRSELHFTNGTIVFNYDKYPLRKSFSGPDTGTAKIERVRYDATNKTVEVGNITGEFWAAPLVRLFAAKTADAIEKYRFHRPPRLLGNGIVDVTKEGRTTLDVSFSSPTPADYVFLGENITLSKPSGIVAIRGKRVTVDKLKLNAFGGPIDARFKYNGAGTLGSEISWTKLSVPSLASTWGFNIKGGGELTGRIECTIGPKGSSSMNGKGLIAIEKTELFAVPMFGPLSPLIGGVINNKKAAFERAKSAFCTFNINNGVLSSHDFQTATTSLTFVGDGWVNLVDRSFDMTMRMNARGLLGLITIPLRPLYGMFQFRGTGTLKNPIWEKTLFTMPTAEQNKLLMSAPKAKIVNGSN